MPTSAVLRRCICSSGARIVRRLVCLLAALLCAVAGASIARADEPWLLAGEATAAVPLAAPQTELFDSGASGSLTLSRAFGATLQLGLRVRGTLLADGPPPADRRRVDPKKGGVFGLGLAARLRLLGDDEDPRRSPGPFLDASIGGSSTGDVIRPHVEVGIGWGIDLGPLTLSPVVRYLHVVESTNDLDVTDAKIGLFGLEVVIWDPPVYVATEGPAVEDVPQAVPGDQDGDGVLDAADSCVSEPEDRDGFRDEDGCPDPDNDEDGVLDADDRCPDAVEDRDGFQDEDGCPDEDNDSDGIPDTTDQCPLQAEVINGITDEDGCPDENEIVFVEDRVVLEERVLFDSERARVKSRARIVLQAIINLWRQHPDWVGMRIEGHTDPRGPADYNLDLSQRRANNVKRFLVELGMPEAMITAEGYGGTRPVTTEATDEAFQRNRRVEFIAITRRPQSASDAGGGTQP